MNYLLKYNIKQIADYYEKLGYDLTEYKRIRKYLPIGLTGTDGTTKIYDLMWNSYVIGLAQLEQKFQVLDQEIARRNKLVGVL